MTGRTHKGGVLRHHRGEMAGGAVGGIEINKMRILTKKTEVAQWIRKKNVYKKNTMIM